MEQLIFDVIAKVREMFKYDMDYSILLGNSPSINVGLYEGKLILQNMTFGTYDKVYVLPTSIKFVDVDGNSERVLCTYSSFEELLNL